MGLIQNDHITQNNKCANIPLSTTYCNLKAHFGCQYSVADRMMHTFQLLVLIQAAPTLPQS